MSVRIYKLVDRAEAIITDDTQNLDQFWRRVMDYKKKKFVTYDRLDSKTFVIVSQSVFEEVEDFINKPVSGKDKASPEVANLDASAPTAIAKDIVLD